MNRPRILLIEDDNDTATLLVQFLSELAYKQNEIFITNDIKQIASISATGLEFVLTALTLPGAECRETLTKVQRRFPYVPIVVIIDTPEIDAAMRAIENGVQGYLERTALTEREFRKTIGIARAHKHCLNDYRRLFDDVPAPMYIYDEQTFTFLAVNDAALRQFGYTREEFLAMDATEIRPATDFEEFRNADKHAPETYFDYGRRRHIRKNGNVFFVHIFAQAIEYSGKNARLILTIDIDEKVRSEMAVAEKNAALLSHVDTIEKQNEQLEQIAWIQSHELRNPVASILGLVPLFDRQNVTNSINTDILEKLEEATIKLDEVIKKITSHTV